MYNSIIQYKYIACVHAAIRKDQLCDFFLCNRERVSISTYLKLSCKYSLQFFSPACIFSSLMEVSHFITSSNYECARFFFCSSFAFPTIIQSPSISLSPWPNSGPCHPSSDNCRTNFPNNVLTPSPFVLKFTLRLYTLPNINLMMMFLFKTFVYKSK